jgi:O-antigen ligase
VAFFGVAILLVAYSHLPDAFTVFNQYGRPYVLAFAGLVLAGTTARQPGGWQTVVAVAGVSLVVVAVVGTVLFVTGGVSLEPDGSLAVFYDSALPALAGAVFLAVLLGLADGRWKWAILIASGLIVVLSGRRNVWAGLVVAIVIVLIVRRRRVLTALRVVSSLGALAAVLVLSSPNLAYATADRLLLAFEEVSGSSIDTSTAGHINDVRYGLKYALNAPVLGLGPQHPPLPGMAVQWPTMYVHNEFLINWLRFGIVGLLIAVTVGLAMIVISARALRRVGLANVEATSALFLVIAPVCAMTAGFFSGTERWPTLLGLTVGSLATFHASRDSSFKISGVPSPAEAKN